MSDTAIRVEGLGKQYRIAGKQEKYRTLRDTLAGAAMAPVRAVRSLAGRNGRHSEGEETFWALKDVSFEVRRGEVVGVIGRNGAGKSTLLKILSRITEPTEGYADIHGRVGSLLEVGTGFHPELSGRENIYLNGAILGMKHAEIDRRFDEMVAFAEIEKFIDTPVKHYSSGMYLRLAFAVAAHLEPEILLVDEVLAVGDAAFQKKCLGKMGEVAEQGRTVLFVSHNIQAINRLCERAILFESGCLSADGRANDVTTEYLRAGDNARDTLAECIWLQHRDAPGDSTVRLHAVRVRNSQGQVAETMRIQEDCRVEVEYWNLQSTLHPTVILHFINEDDICLFATNDFNNKEWLHTERKPGLVRASCLIPGNFLAEGRIFVLVAIGTYNPNVVHAHVRDVVSFQVIDRTIGEGARGSYSGRWPGVVRPLLRWDIEEVAAPSEDAAPDPDKEVS